jgi:hypothetical protein
MSFLNAYLIGGRVDGSAVIPIIVDHSNFTGTNYGFGITLAAGWKNFFAAIPVTNRSLFSAA